MENLDSKIKLWKEEIMSEDSDTAINASTSLSKIGGDDIVKFLIELLYSEDVGIRNRAALALREIGDSQAVEPLLSTILKLENRNYNGTLVYALENLNCTTKLVELFLILYYESYEAKWHTYTILNEQFFEFSKKELLEIEKEHKNWEQNHKYKCEEDVVNMICDAYNGFVTYLE